LEAKRKIGMIEYWNGGMMGRLYLIAESSKREIVEGMLLSQNRLWGGITSRQEMVY